MTYADAVRQIVAAHKQRQAAYEQAELDLLSRNAEFAESERKKRELLLKQAKGEKVSGSMLREVLAENGKIRQNLGLVPPAPHCAVCGDTGRVNGKYCDCVVSLTLKEQSNEVGIPLHKFDDVDFSVYGEQAQSYKKVFGDLQTIAKLYPHNKKRCIVISGGTGNGKTYLAGCFAAQLLERGMSVVALTAFAANNRFLKYHTTFDEKKANHLDPLLDCTLLVLDDLGTESILKNVTTEYLYQVINERNTSGKLTLLTTNLTSNLILDRYGERIYSRLFDKSLSYAVTFTGKDIRSAL